MQPLRYGFEAILSNEFHTLDAPCAALVPQGPGYENVSLVNQVCTTVGSISGQVNVDGNRFLNLLYEYSYSNLWRVSRFRCLLKDKQCLMSFPAELRRRRSIWYLLHYHAAYIH